jgi:hypothetical protein
VGTFVEVGVIVVAGRRVLESDGAVVVEAELDEVGIVAGLKVGPQDELFAAAGQRAVLVTTPRSRSSAITYFSLPMSRLRAPPSRA